MLSTAWNVVFQITISFVCVGTRRSIVNSSYHTTSKSGFLVSSFEQNSPNCGIIHYSESVLATYITRTGVLNELRLLHLPFPTRHTRSCTEGPHDQQTHTHIHTARHNPCTRPLSAVGVDSYQVFKGQDLLLVKGHFSFRRGAGKKMGV